MDIGRQCKQADSDRQLSSVRATRVPVLVIRAIPGVLQVENNYMTTLSTRHTASTSMLVGVYRPFSAQIWLYQRRVQACTR